MKPQALKPNPPVRADGLCYGCKEPRRQPIKGSQIPEHASLLASDPFCSTECARGYHGVSVRSSKPGKKPKAAK